jgi:opacity protein-like surface antigen
MKIRLLLYTSCAVLFLSGICAPAVIHSQTTLLQRDVRKQMERNQQDDFGPNSKFFQSGVLGFAWTMPINTNDSLEVTNDINSNQLVFGNRYKLKLNEYFALGMDIVYMRQGFSIRQGNTNLLSPEHIHKKQRLAFHNLAVGGHVRINFQKRGDYLGSYVDLGAELHWVMAERHFTLDKVDPSQHQGAEKIRIQSSHLDFTRDIQHYAVARFGVNTIIASARYRFSDIFNASENINNGMKLPELPRFSIGVEIVF